MKELVRCGNNWSHIGMPFFFHYDINFKKIPRKRRYDAIRGLGKEATAIYTNFLSGAIFTGERRLMQNFIDSVKCSYLNGVDMMASFAGAEAAKERLGGAYLVYDIMAEPHRVIRWRGDKA